MRVSSLLLGCCLTACATASASKVTDAPPTDTRAPGERWAAWPGDVPEAVAPVSAGLAAGSPGATIAASAGRIDGLRSLRAVTKRLPDDCTGVVRYAYEAAGVELMGDGVRGDNGVTAIWRKAERFGAVHLRAPRPGDLVFFRETYDRNRDGKRNDGLTHVAVVVAVEPGGTVVFVHHGSKGVTRARLNTSAPTQRARDGRVLNDVLRPKSKKSRAYLTGELFAGYASARKLAARPALVAGR